MAARALTSHRVHQLMLVNFVNATSIGAISLSLLLYIDNQVGSLAVGGVFVGVFGLANAVGLVLQGHLLDRHPPRLILAPAGVLYCLSLILLVTTGVTRRSAAVGLVLTLVAGCCLPAVTTSGRTLLSELTLDGRQRLRAYSWLTSTFQAGTALGPVIVSASLAISGPAVAVLASALLGILSVIGLPSVARTSVARRQSPVKPVLPVRSPLTVPGLQTLLVSEFAGGLGSGMVAVGIPAVALHAGHAEAAGYVLAANAIGDIIGGLLYGHAHWRTDMRWRLTAAQWCALAAAIGTALATANLLALGLLLFATGFTGAPVGITTTALLDRVVNRQILGQSVALTASAGLVSAATGAMLAGLASHRPWVVLGLAAAAMAIAAVWTLARQSTLAVGTSANPPSPASRSRETP